MTGHASGVRSRNTRNVRVLVTVGTDDEAAPLLSALESAGFVAQHSRVGDAVALEQAIRDPHWELVLAGASPGLSSLEVLRTVRGSLLDVPLLVVSGPDDLSEPRAVRAGADGWVSADRIDRLGEAVRQTLAREDCRRAAERAARHLALSQLALDALDESVCWARSDGRLVLVNAAICSALGYPQPDLLRMQMSDFVPDFGESGWQSCVARLRTEASLELDTVHRRRDGSEVDVRLRLRRVVSESGDFVVVCARERQQVQRTEELQSSERKYRQIFETAASLITSVDERGILVDCNERATAVLGYSPAELLGESMTKIIHPDDHAKAAASLEEILRVGHAHGRTYKMVRKDGKVIDVSINASSLPAANGHGPRTLCVIDDITEQRRLQARLAQADRLASVGLLAAGVVHEINNPLTYLLHCLEEIREGLQPLLGAESRDASEQELRQLYDSVAEASTGAERVATIVRDLKTFSRVDGDEVAPLDVIAVLRSSTRMARHEITHRARLVEDFDPVPPVLGTEGRLGQVFLNLLLNAVQSTEEGKPGQNEIRLRVRRAGPRVLVEVCDTGCGVAPEHLPRLFDPFFTTKAREQGSGLGLPICKDLIEGLGGDLQVESTPGHGTTVRVSLPQASPVVVEPRAAEAAAPRRGRILAVDDEPLILKLYERMLGRAHQVTCVSSGAEAKVLLEGDAGFDLVLTDLMMEDVSGIDLHDWIQDHHPHLAPAVVFITGGVFTPRGSAYLSRLPNARIDKPIDATSLRALVQRLLEVRSD